MGKQGVAMKISKLGTNVREIITEPRLRTDNIPGHLIVEAATKWTRQELYFDPFLQNFCIRMIISLDIYSAPSN